MSGLCVWQLICPAEFVCFVSSKLFTDQDSRCKPFCANGPGPRMVRISSLAVPWSADVRHNLVGVGVSTKCVAYAEIETCAESLVMFGGKLFTSCPRPGSADMDASLETRDNFLFFLMHGANVCGTSSLGANVCGTSSLVTLFFSLSCYVVLSSCVLCACAGGVK